jgi:hypothetical protein
MECQGLAAAAAAQLLQPLLLLLLLLYQAVDSQPAHTLPARILRPAHSSLALAAVQQQGLVG